MGGRRPVAVHGHRNGHHGVGHDVAQFRPRTAVDRPGGQMEQEIDDARPVVSAEQPAIKLL